MEEKANLFNSMLPELRAAGAGCAEVKIASAALRKDYGATHAQLKTLSM